MLPLEKKSKPHTKNKWEKKTQKIINHQKIQTKPKQKHQKKDPLCPKLCFIKLQVKRLRNYYELLDGENS